jgi:ketosteroid isomerase-like protein
MKSLLLLTVSMLIPAFAADPKAEVEKAERSFGESIVKADVPALEKLLASDLVYTHSSGTRDTRDSFLSNIRGGTLKYEKMDYSKIEPQMVRDDVAFVAARAEVRVVSSGKPNDMKLSLLHVFVRRQGRWQLVAHQSARLP